MASPAPVLRLLGKIHAVVQRHVPAAAEKPAVVDSETGRTTRRAQPGRTAYDVFDVTILTSDGGFATVLVRPEDIGVCFDGTVPAAGDSVDWPIRSYVGWGGPDYQRYRLVGFSLAADVLAAAKPASSGARVRALSESSTGS